MAERVGFGETGKTGLGVWGGMVSEAYTSRLEWPAAYAVSLCGSSCTFRATGSDEGSTLGCGEMAIALL